MGPVSPSSGGGHPDRRGADDQWEMTAAQEQAIEKIQDLVREHFDSGLILVESEDERDIQWHGGFSAAIGNCEIAKRRLLLRLDNEESKDVER